MILFIPNVGFVDWGLGKAPYFCHPEAVEPILVVGGEGVDGRQPSGGSAKIFGGCGGGEEVAEHSSDFF